MTFTITTADLDRPSYLVTTFDSDGNTVEVTGSDFSTNSTRNRAVKNMRQTLASQGLTEVEAKTSTVEPEASVHLDAGQAMTDEALRVHRLALAIIDNPAKIANPIIDGIDTVDEIDYVTQAESEQRGRKGIIGRLNRRRAALTAADQLAASYLEGSDIAATDAEETAAAETSTVEPKVASDDEKAYEAEIAAVTSEAKTEKAEPKVTKRQSALLDMAHDLYGMVEDGETVEVPFDGQTVEGFDIFPKGATQGWYWRTMPGMEAARLSGVDVKFTKTGLVVSRDLERTLAEAKAHVAHIEHLIAKMEG